MRELEHDSILVRGIIQDISLLRVKRSPFCRTALNDDVIELASSIGRQGLLQPIIVRPVGRHFEIVAGNRRYIACRSLRWKRIPSHIVELDDREAFEVALIENIQRKTLNPIEEARAFEKYVSDFGWGGVTELATKIGKSVSYVAKRINLLKLPHNLLSLVLDSSMPVSLAEELESVKDKTEQINLAKLICGRRLSLRKARHLINATVHDCENITSTISDFVVYKRKPAYDSDRRAKRSFDKSIVTLRIALMRLGEVINNVQDDWLVYEILMQHKNMLHGQIDLLIKQKMKIK
jgi:ParB family transcriptional regulator, chromosome partitioning protein